MKRYRKLTPLLLLTILFSTSLFSQNSFNVDKRYIFVLDITKSMCGYGGAPDIFDEVKSQLIDAINNIQDEDADIYLSTFQNSIIDSWSEKATNNGKAKLIRNLKNIDCKKLPISYTNLVAAWEEVERNINKDKMNIVFMLTDGEHNMPNVSKNNLLRKVENWDNLTANHSKGAYAFFVELVDAAVDPAVRSSVNKTGKVQIITGIEFFVLQLKDNKQVINIEDELVFSLDFEKDNWNEKYNNFSVTLVLEDDSDDFILEKENYRIDELPANVKIKSIKHIALLKSSRPKKFDVPIKVTYDESKFPQIKLLNNKINLQVNNKKEKILYLDIVD